MRRFLLVLAVCGGIVLCAGHAGVLAQSSAVTSTFDLLVTDEPVTIREVTLGDTVVVDTVALSGTLDISATVVPPNPIRLSALVTLDGIGEDTGTCYLVQGGSVISTDPHAPVDPYLPGDPYHVTFTTKVIALRPTDPYAPGDPYVPAAPCEADRLRSQAPPQAAVLYPLRIEVALIFDADGVLTSATLEALTVPLGTPGE